MNDGANGTKGLKILCILVGVLGVIVFARYRYVEATKEVATIYQQIGLLKPYSDAYEQVKAKGAPVELVLRGAGLALDQSGVDVSSITEAVIQTRPCHDALRSTSQGVGLVFFSTPVPCQKVGKLFEGAESVGDILDKASSVLGLESPVREPAPTSSSPVSIPSYTRAAKPGRDHQSPEPRRSRTVKTPPTTPTKRKRPSCDFQVVSVTLRVPERKSDGRHWDAVRGKPDVRVEVRVQGGTAKTRKEEDSYGEMTLELKSPLSVQTGGSVEVIAKDMDLGAHDLIADEQGILPTDAFAGRLKMKNFTLNLRCREL